MIMSGKADSQHLIRETTGISASSRVQPELNVSESETFYILALDGGGTRGIYPAQVLANLEQKLGVSVKDCFDLIAGTSTGAIIAGAAAAGLPMTEVVALFEREAPRIFRKRPCRLGFFGSKYSAKPLAAIIGKLLPTATLGSIKTPLLITSSDLSTGGVYVFKSRYLKDLGEEYVRDGNTRLSDAILASCAAPSFFDPAKLGDYLLADGGLWANNPSIIALTEAVSKFGQAVERVSILSIGTGRETRFYRRHKHWGILTGWERQKLVAYFLNLQSQASANMSGLLLQDRYLRLDPEIDDWPLDDTKHLGNLKALADRDFTRNSGQISAYIKGVRK